MAKLPLPFVSPVKGVSFRPEAVALVEVGMPALIEHDPNNAYDANACTVVVGNQVIGHLPAQLAARLVGRGEGSWSGTVVEKIGKADIVGVRVRVESPALVSVGASSFVFPTAQPGPADREVVADVEARSSQPVVTQAVERERAVSSRSGRRLGVFDRIEGDKVIVRIAGSKTASYPAELVLVEVLDDLN